MPKEEESEDQLVSIDEHALDQEWVKQPGLVWKYAKRLAKAKLEQARAKANRDVVAAEQSKLIRKRPDAYHLDKVTESTVEGAMLLTDKYKEALELLNQTSYTVDMLQAMITALEHKKRGLENLVTLHGQNYYSEPRVVSSPAGDAAKKAMDDYIQRAANAKLKPMKRKGE